MIFKKLFYTITLFIFFVFAQHENVIAKEYPMIHYTMEDGLPSNMIYNIYQEPSGILWISTDKGVSRYNGIKFENFTTSDGLADNECFFFCPDKYGRLWIATYNGKLCYYQNDTFHNAQNTPWLKLPFNASNTKTIRSNKDGTILITFGEKGFVAVDHNRIKVFQYPAKGMFHFFVQKNSSNVYQVISKSEEIFIDTNSKVLQRKKINGLKRALAFWKKDSGEGAILLSENDSFYSTSLELKYPEFWKYAQKLAINGIYDNDKSIFLATNSGLLKDGLEWILPHFNVYFVKQDIWGNFWIGTSDNGLYRLEKDFVNKSIITNAYKNPIIYAQSKGDYFFYGTNNNDVFSANQNLDCFYQLFNAEKKLESIAKTEFSHVMTKNNYYIIGYKKIIEIPIIYNKKTNSAKIISRNNEVTSKNNIIIDSMWYMFNSSQIFKTNIKQFVLEPSTKPKLIIQNDAIMYFLGVSPHNQIWFSTINKMFRLRDTIAEHQTQFGSNAFRQFTFSQNSLIGISHQNELIICNKYESEKIQFDTIKNANCVWDKFYNLNDSTLLISTNNYFRVLKFRTTQGKPNYSISVIENPSIPYQPEFVYVGSTSCFFFKNASINSYPIASILAPQPLPKIFFTRLQTLRSIEKIKHVMYVEYGASQNIKVQFRTVSFFNQSLRYEYQISSLNNDDQWTTFDGESLNLIKIGYGSFRISVRAKTLSGSYSEPATITLIVSKPYWATWWFLTLVLTLASILIFIIARIIIKRKLQKKDNEVRFLRSEFKAMNALMNPHFIFNSLNSLQSLVNNNENSKASKYIRTFADLIRQNMKNISQELIPLENEINLVNNYLQIEKLRFKDNLNYTIEIAEEVETDMIRIPPLLIQPLVENAIKHGIWPQKNIDGLVSIHIYEDVQNLIVSIKDNGKGFGAKSSSDTMHESYAMKNIHSRIKQLSKIHQIKIEVFIAEMKDEAGTIIGVESMLIIERDDFKK